MNAIDRQSAAETIIQRHLTGRASIIGIRVALRAQHAAMNAVIIGERLAAPPIPRTTTRDQWRAMSLDLRWKIRRTHDPVERSRLWPASISFGCDPLDLAPCCFA